MSQRIQAYKLAYRNCDESNNTDYLIISIFKNVLSYFRNRKTLKELDAKSDAALKDIGIERAWIESKLKKTPSTKFNNIGW